MADIVKRLRKASDEWSDHNVLDEAADEIERLRVALKAVLEAMSDDGDRGIWDKTCKAIVRKALAPP